MRLQLQGVMLLVVAAGLGLAADASDEAIQKENKLLTGSWIMVSGEENGKPVPEDFLKKCKLTITGDKHTVTLGDDTSQASHKLDPTKGPKTMDIARADGVRFVAIYKLDGDTFTLCLTDAAKPRPKEFSAKAGSGQRVHVWKRVK